MRLGEVLKKATRKPIILRCPRCGSTKIRPLLSIDGWILPERYYCAECGYSGPMISVEKATSNSSERDTPSSGA